MTQVAYALKSGAALTYQLPLYDSDLTGEDAYGRYPISAVLGAVIFHLLATAYPGITISFGGVAPTAAETARLVNDAGYHQDNILYAQEQ